MLPPHHGPTETVPVTMSDVGLDERDGIEAKAAVVGRLAKALEVIRRSDPARITTLGGECSVSVAPFSELARRRQFSTPVAAWEVPTGLDSGEPRCRR
ncbi:arginase family enzyme [Nonomuraea jabiensis]|uniref:Arginase family enzyme n=1 Tax=Nonomuraea jabiensis TaxID=882448 RepID=A0A7W9GF74_9ACTN|nr:arginase family enzyme [Nonomuraea jabiensis]